MNFDIFDHLMSSSIGKPYGERPPHFTVSSQLLRVIRACPTKPTRMWAHRSPWLAGLPPSLPDTLHSKKCICNISSKLANCPISFLTSSAIFVLGQIRCPSEAALGLISVSRIPRWNKISSLFWSYLNWKVLLVCATAGYQIQKMARTSA